MILYDCDAEALSNSIRPSQSYSPTIKWRCCPRLVQFHGFRPIEVLLDIPPGRPKNCPKDRGGSVRVQISPSRPISVFMIKPRVCPSRGQFSPVQSRRPLGFGQVLSDQPAASCLEHCELVCLNSTWNLGFPLSLKIVSQREAELSGQLLACLRWISVSSTLYLVGLRKPLIRWIENTQRDGAWPMAEWLHDGVLTLSHKSVIACEGWWILKLCGIIGWPIMFLFDCWSIGQWFPLLEARSWQDAKSNLVTVALGKDDQMAWCWTLGPPAGTGLELYQCRGVNLVTLTGSSLTRHVALPDHGVGLDGQSCSCLAGRLAHSSPTLGVGRPSVMFLFDCWPVGRPMLRTACFEHSNFFKVTAPEARPGQLRPGAYRRQKRQADRNWKTDETRPRPCKRENLKLGAKRSTGKFAGKVPGKFTGDNPAIDLNPALDSVGPNSPTLRTRSVHTRTSVCVRQHTQDVRGRPSAHTGRPAVNQYTYQHAPWTVRVILAHVGCLFSTHRTSVSTRRTSVAVRVCPCVRQCTQDVRQHTQDVRQHTQDVRQHTQDVRVCPSAHVGRPSVHTGRLSAHKGRSWPSVAVRQYTQDVHGRPSAHTGRPSVHRGRPWPSVSTHRTSVSTRRTSVAVRVCPCVRQYTQDVRQYTQDVRQHTQDVRGRPSVHTGRPWSSVSTHISMLALPADCSGDFGPRGLSVQYTQDVRQHTQDVRACPLAHTDFPWTDPCTELISACWPFPWTVRVLILDN
ncbi:hypothetical protein YC2023_071570 [Brassica napus]